MLFNRSTKRESPYPLIVGMSGVKLGDRVVQIGCANGGPLAAIAAKTGLSGRAVAVVPDDASAARAQKAAAKQGVLVEVEIAPPTRLPLGESSVDLAIADDMAGSFSSLPEADRAAAIREMARVVRPGGRAMIIGSAPRQGLGALLSRAPAVPSIAVAGEATRALEAGGFKGARTLAEREGLVFVEGIKPRTG